MIDHSAFFLYPGRANFNPNPGKPLVLAQPTSFIPDPLKPVVGRRTIAVTSGQKYSGTFLTLVEPSLVLVAIDVPGVKTGIVFGLDRLRNRREDRPMDYYRRYANLYKALRAYRLHIHGWAVASESILADMSTLFRASLLATYGVNILKPGEFEKLQERLRPIIYRPEGDGEFSKNKKATHAVAMYRVTKARDGSKKKVLGFMSAAARIEDRRHEVEETRDAVFSIGNILAHYIGAVLAQVRKVREGLETLLPLESVDLYTQAHADALARFGQILKTVLAGRPFTHVGGYAPDECAAAARIVREGLAGASRVEDFVALRELIATTRNSLLLLEWQYSLEVFITSLAEWVRTKYEPAQEEWRWLSDFVHNLALLIPQGVGRRFKNNVEPDIRKGIDAAYQLIESSGRAHEQPLDPVKILGELKQRLVAISGKI